MSRAKNELVQTRLVFAWTVTYDIALQNRPKLWQLSACSVIAFLKYIQVFTSR